METRDAAVTKDVTHAKLTGLLESLRIGVSGDSEGDDLVSEPPSLPLIDQIRLVSAHIDSVKNEIAKQISSETDGADLIIKQTSRVLHLQNRYEQVSTEIDRIERDDRTEKIGALRAAVARDVAALNTAKSARASEEQASRFAELFTDAAEAIDDLQALLDSAYVETEDLATASERAWESCSYLGIFNKNDTDVKRHSEFSWLTQSASSTPTAVRNLAERLKRIEREIDEILHAAWADAVDITNAGEGFASVTGKSLATITYDDASTQLPLDELSNTLKSRSLLDKLVKGIAGDFLSNIARPLLEIPQSQTPRTWTASVTDVTLFLQEGPEGAPHQTIITIMAVLYHMKHYIFDVLNLQGNFPDLQFEFARAVIPVLVPLCLTFMKRLLPDKLEKPIAERAVHHLNEQATLASQLIEALRSLDYLTGGLEAEIEQLDSFAENPGKHFLRSITMSARSRCRDLLLKENSNGWEGVSIEVEVSVLPPAMPAPPMEMPIATFKSTPAISSGREEDDWDAWDEEEGATKAAPAQVSPSPVSAGVRSPDVTPTKLQGRQKKSALGGVRVVKPKDQLGSGPMPDDDEEWGWGIEEEASTPAATKPSVATDKTSATLADEDDWFAQELRVASPPPTKVAPMRKSNVKMTRTSTMGSDRSVAGSDSSRVLTSPQRSGTTSPRPLRGTRATARTLHSPRRVTSPPLADSPRIGDLLGLPTPSSSMSGVETTHATQAAIDQTRNDPSDIQHPEEAANIDASASSDEKGDHDVQSSAAFAAKAAPVSSPYRTEVVDLPEAMTQSEVHPQPPAPSLSEASTGLMHQNVVIASDEQHFSNEIQDEAWDWDQDAGDAKARDQGLQTQMSQVEGTHHRSVSSEEPNDLNVPASVSDKLQEEDGEAWDWNEGADKEVVVSATANEATPHATDTHPRTNLSNASDSAHIQAEDGIGLLDVVHEQEGSAHEADTSALDVGTQAYSEPARDAKTILNEQQVEQEQPSITEEPSCGWNVGEDAETLSVEGEQAGINPESDVSNGRAGEAIVGEGPNVEAEDLAVAPEYQALPHVERTAYDIQDQASQDDQKVSPSVQAQDEAASERDTEGEAAAWDWDDNEEVDQPLVEQMVAEPRSTSSIPVSTDREDTAALPSHEQQSHAQNADTISTQGDLASKEVESVKADEPAWGWSEDADTSRNVLLTIPAHSALPETAVNPDQEHANVADKEEVTFVAQEGVPDAPDTEVVDEEPAWDWNVDEEAGAPLAEASAASTLSAAQIAERDGHLATADLESYADEKVHLDDQQRHQHDLEEKLNAEEPGWDWDENEGGAGNAAESVPEQGPIVDDNRGNGGQEQVRDSDLRDEAPHFLAPSSEASMLLNQEYERDTGDMWDVESGNIAETDRSTHSIQAEESNLLDSEDVPTPLGRAGDIFAAVAKKPMEVLEGLIPLNEDEEREVSTRETDAEDEDRWDWGANVEEEDQAKPQISNVHGKPLPKPLDMLQSSSSAEAELSTAASFTRSRHSFDLGAFSSTESAPQTARMLDTASEDSEVLHEKTNEDTARQATGLSSGALTLNVSAMRDFDDEQWGDMPEEAVEPNEVLSGSDGVAPSVSVGKSSGSGEKLSDVPTEPWEDLSVSNLQQSQAGISAPSEVPVESHSEPLDTPTAHKQEDLGVPKDTLDEDFFEQDHGANEKADVQESDAWGWNDEEEEVQGNEGPADKVRGDLQHLADTTTHAPTAAERVESEEASLGPSSIPSIPVEIKRKEKCLISQRSVEFVNLLGEVMDDMQAVLEEGLVCQSAGLDVKHLAECFDDLLDLHRALMPIGHADTLNNVPTLAAQFFNDCTYITRELLRIDSRWKTLIDKHDDQGVNLAIEKQAQATALLGQRSFDAQIVAQQQMLEECLIETNNFEATYDEVRFRQCQRAMRQIVIVMEQLSKAWKPVLTASNHQMACGRLIDGILQRILHDIIALSDISEVEGEKLSELVKSLGELENLFRDEPNGDEIQEGQLSDVALHVPSWFKATYLSDILTGSLVDIEFLYFEAGALVDYTKDELISLLKALFSDSPKRTRLIERIQNATV